MYTQLIKKLIPSMGIGLIIAILGTISFKLIVLTSKESQIEIIVFIFLWLLSIVFIFTAKSLANGLKKLWFTSSFFSFFTSFYGFYLFNEHMNASKGASIVVDIYFFAVLIGPALGIAFIFGVLFLFLAIATDNKKLKSKLQQNTCSPTDI